MSFRGKLLDEQLIYFDGEEYLKAEETILKENISTPQLFFCIWNKPSLVLGFNQDGKDGIDMEFCNQNNIKVLRRQSGGSGVFYNMDISFSLFLPSAHPLAKGIHHLYKQVLDWLSLTLKDYKIETKPYKCNSSLHAKASALCFENPTFESLMINDKKAAGCAQVRRSTGVLVHGLILFEPDILFHSRIFCITEERIKNIITGIGNIDKNTLILNLKEKAQLVFL